MIQEFHQPSLLISGKKDHRQYIFSSGHQGWIVQADSNTPPNRPSELFITDHFISQCNKMELRGHHSFILQQGPRKLGVLLKNSYKAGTKDHFFENCGTLILDYAIKYSYIDPTNKPITQQKIFPLHRKKSFYSTMSPYEMDQD